MKISRAFAMRALPPWFSITLLLCSVAAVAQDRAASSSAYAQRAPIEQYLMESADAEARLARSAAPPSIAADADVLVLERTGHRVAAKGTNGFVCMVWRSWSDDFDDPEFFSPKVRSPICLNPVSVRTVLPHYLRRTEWFLAGLSLAEIRSRFESAVSRGELRAPDPGAMSYMMSHEGFLADALGHGAPHIMFFVPRADRQNWAADRPGSPVLGAEAPNDPVAVFFVLVPRWSDGTPAIAH